MLLCFVCNFINQPATNCSSFWLRFVLFVKLKPVINNQTKTSVCLSMTGMPKIDLLSDNKKPKCGHTLRDNIGTVTFQKIYLLDLNRKKLLEQFLSSVVYYKTHIANLDDWICYLKTLHCY